ncbi:hypothetical protein CQW23_34125 [Capsicum baccatum]|uniref:GPI ethanolamine phosphate transferase 2 C-terminal domain-containing protein n=1 Tax=Capsicum baccatum TaxID=33114 RepID=A0A2G2UZR3_CAPBA|nr:hypothetical protein CQW23_34125 [Capsicum baccatum]
MILIWVNERIFNLPASHGELCFGSSEVWVTSQSAANLPLLSERTFSSKTTSVRNEAHNKHGNHIGKIVLNSCSFLPAFEGSEVDLASTLALLFGVPIPKNNVGMLMPETFKSFTVDQQLRLLELNSWQLLRLLQAQLPGLVCENFLCDSFWDDKSERTRGYSSLEENFCCLFMRAAELHRSWKSREEKRSSCEDNCHSTVVAYHDFLRTARKQVFSEQNNQFSSVNNDLSRWHLDDIFILVHIVTRTEKNTSATVDSKTNNYIHICSILVILISGRILGGWHQAIVAAARELNACTISLPVAALYYMGMAGHFGLGNTNTLATIDVAGAFIGVLNHSTVLSGVLMFIITYASPMLYLLSMVMYNSVKDTSGFIISQDGNIDSLLKRTLGFPCLVPLGLNSILLIAYTIVLLLMRNHLFVWSVFSPKFLYVCATTVCVCLGVSIVSATMFYICLILFQECRQYTIRAREIDPNHSEVLEIIAITDILMLPESINGQPNYYAILNVPNYSDDQQVMLNNFKSLMELLRSNTIDYSRLANEAFMLVMRAYGVLANPIGADWHP